MSNKKLLVKTNKFMRNRVFCQNKLTSEENLIQFQKKPYFLIDHLKSIFRLGYLFGKCQSLIRLAGRGEWVRAEVFIQVNTFFCRFNMVSVLCDYILCEVMKRVVYCVKYAGIRDLLLFANLSYLRIFIRYRNVRAIISKSHVRLIFNIKKPTDKPAFWCILSRYFTFADVLENYRMRD